MVRNKTTYPKEGKMKLNGRIFYSRYLTGVLAAGIIVSFAVTTAQARDKELTLDVDLNITSTADATAFRNLNFGVIDLDPAGDNFVIDATGGDAVAAKTTGGTSILSSTGNSGIIRVVGNTAFNITVTYPTSVTLNGTGSPVNVISIASHSQAPDSGAGVNHTAGGTTDIHVGGEIQLTGDEDGTYSNTMPVTVHFN